ncbi:hypothetical protein PGB90_007595 [Kerria lacca]
MEALYHKTKQSILEIEDCFQKLGKLRQSLADTNMIEAEIQDKINLVKKNCDRLDIFIQKEPATSPRKQNYKLKIDELKYDCSHFQTSLQKCQMEKSRKMKEEREREELLNRRFTVNKDTAIYIDYSVEHQKSLQSANRGVDELIYSGSSILDNLRDQKNKLKGARRKLLDIGNTLGLSSTTMKYIERRAREDKYILIGGMLVTLIVIILVIIYLI